MKALKMPTAYTILFAILIAAALLTWVVPAGQYQRLEDGEPIPGTYVSVEANGQGAGQVMTAAIRGFYDAVDVAMFILMVGGFLGVVMKTGAITAGISGVITRLRGRERLMIPILMVLFGLGGTSYGMWEETIAFYPLLIPVFVAAGFDTLTAVAVIMLGAGAGVLASTVNPFATGIASGFAGVSIGDGILLRVIQLVLLEGGAIWFVMAYAAKVRKEPEKSLVYDLWPSHRQHFGRGEKAPGELTGRGKVTIALFALTFLVMIYSVIPFQDLGITFLPTLGWWFQELAALFLVAGIVVGLVGGLTESQVAESFVAGAADMLGVTMIIAISRGITVLMNDGLITDTILHSGEAALTGLSSRVFALVTYLLYMVLSVFIPSTSGLATLSVPIMAPLGDFAGVGRDMVVTAFQSASGVVNLITPTGAVVMGALTLGKIPYDRWVKFAWKYILGAFVLSALLIFLWA